MKSKELAQKLRSYAHGGHVDHHGRRSPQWKGQKSFALFFADYLESIDFSREERYDFSDITPHLPQLVVEAFDELRMPSNESNTRHKGNYESETGRDVPDLVTLGASDILSQQSALQTTVGYMLLDIYGEERGIYVVHEIDVYCKAQRMMLQQVFDRFLLKVWRDGMFEMVENCKQRGMSGTFGATELRVFTMAGRVMYTFARRKKKGKPGMYPSQDGDGIVLNEHSVSFVGEDGSRLNLGAGLQSIFTDLSTAVSMMTDVIEHWANTSERARMFVGSESVSIM